MSQWPMVPLSDVLKLQRRWIKPHHAETYREIGIRSFGNGIFHKAPVEGSLLGNKRVLRIEPGDLVFNNVFAWEGAVAVVGSEQAGMIGSHRFVTYTVNPNKSTAEFLKLFFMTSDGLEILLKASPGSAGRNKTLGLDRFIAQSIPLPSLAEQRRLVERIHALRAKIEEANGLRERIRREQRALSTAVISSLVEELKNSGSLGDVLLAPPRNGWSARCDGLDTGTAVLSLGAVTGFWYRADQCKWTSEATNPDAHYWLQPGDLLMSRSNSPELVGHAAIYDGSPAPCIYPDLLMRLRIDTERCHTRFVHYILQSRCVRNFIRTNAKGTSPTMKKISQGIVMGIPFPTTCPMDQQLEIVNRLDTIRGRLTAVAVQQADAAKGLHAMLPAFLQRALNG